MHRANAILLGVCLLCLIGDVSAEEVPCLSGSGPDLRTRAKDPLLVTVDLGRPHQTIHGFGASDCWTLQFIGRWPLEKRNAMAELLFSTGLDAKRNPRGIGLSIWRFNLGAGSSRQSHIESIWRRADTFLSEDGSTYDWSRLRGQRWFLRAASQRGVPTLILFANSPPTAMTRNGKAFGEGRTASTNLADAHFDSFASYLVDVVKHFEQEGIVFSFVSPVNEPEWDWESASQEGCCYSSDDILVLLQLLSAKLRREGLTTRLLMPESAELKFLIESTPGRPGHLEYFFGSAWSASLSAMTGNRICGHSYYTDTPSSGLFTARDRLREALDRYHGLEYWMTEYCMMGPDGPGRPEGMDAALHVARVIHFDLAVAGASSWQWWLAVSVYDYKDGLIYADMNPDDGSFAPSKILWVMGNYSRFIRPGARRVTVSRSDDAHPEQTAEGLMVSAYHHPSGGRTVLVLVNRRPDAVPISLRFVGPDPCPAIRGVVPFITDDRCDLTACPAVPAGQALRIPPRSVVTLVTSTGVKEDDRSR